MNTTMNSTMSRPRAAAEPKPREELLRVIVAELKACGISVDQRVLIVGGSAADEQLLRQVGFKDILNSNLPTDMDRLNGEEATPDTKHVALDAEQMDLPSDSYDLVFASEVLHHCSSPHHALCEMLRVSRRYVVFMEPNDSAAMNALVRMNFSFPYELPAVIDHDYQSGGLRDSNIPNFIYRWNRHEVVKTVSSCIPERIFSVRAHPYWDFSVTKEELDRRKATRIGSITSLIGASNFIALLRVAQLTLNWIRPLRDQGNKFFCCIDKGEELKPWMAREGKEIVYNREYSG
jgi:SAM-dependent methyltransferase